MVVVQKCYIGIKVLNWTVIVTTYVSGPSFVSFPNTALALYIGKMLQLAPMLTSPSIKKICNDGSWLSHNGLICESGF